MVRSVFQRTFLNSQMLRIEWKVGDILCDGSLESTVFAFYGFQWMLCLQKKVRDPQFARPHRISISYSKGNSSTCKSLIIQSFIEDSNKEARHSTKYSFDPYDSKKVILFVDFSSNLTELKGELMTDAAIHGLTFVFILTPVSEDKNVKKEEKALQASIDAEAEASSESLAVDFRRLLDDGTGSDVTLKCGDHAVPAHRNILSARSKVLAAMLSTDMAESRTGVVEISDMTPPIFDQLVQFVYSGKLSDLTLDTAQQLYAAGDKYSIESLKVQCSAFMKKNLTDGNACSVVALADTHSDADLKEWAVAYIIQAELMRKDDVWLKFCDDYPRLANEILNRVYKEITCFKPPK